MLNLPLFAVKAFVRHFLHVSQFTNAEPAVYRRAFERFALPKPLGVRRRPLPRGAPRAQGGTSAGAPRGEWLVPLRPKPGECILYLHGGAFCFGSLATHRELAGRIARRSRRRVFLLDYRLAPEHPYPAPQEDALAAFAWLVERGHSPDGITVMGDSAGGNLCLSLALSLRDRGVSGPGRLVLLSPWVDLTCEQDVDPALQAREVMLGPDFGAMAAAQHCGGRDPREPSLSPVFADLRGLPPMLVQVGSDEVLQGDATRLADEARAGGVTVDLQIWPSMFHVWHAFGPFLRDARRAHDEIARFLDGEPAGRTSSGRPPTASAASFRRSADADTLGA